MEPLGFLTDVFVVFVISGAVVYAFHWLSIPPVVGLLAAGVVIGPSALSVVHDTERVQLLAEIGVIILLFTVGLEVSLSRLWGMGLSC